MSDKTPPAAKPAAQSVEESPVIETLRLRLRMFRESDLDNLASLFADPEVMRYVEDGQPKDREVAEKALASILAHWQRNGFGRWAVEEKTSKRFVGFGGLRSLLGTPEVVYHLATAEWGKGYATELATAALQFGFNNRGFERIVAVAKPANTASIHVMEKIGMRFEQRTSYYGIEVVQYSITGEEFRQRQ